MSNQRKQVQARRLRRQRHVRKRLFGTVERPRLAVFRSSKHIYAQVINDDTGTTLASASTLDPDVRKEQRLRRQQVRPPRSSAGSSPSGPSRPVLTRFASTVEATSITAGSRPWPTPPARRGCNSESGPLSAGRRGIDLPSRALPDLTMDRSISADADCER